VKLPPKEYLRCLKNRKGRECPGDLKREGRLSQALKTKAGAVQSGSGLQMGISIFPPRLEIASPEFNPLC
jgi:hypothetical protein